MEMKVCTKCGVSKPISDFYKNKHTLVGITARCKPCLREQSTVWAKNNPERRRELYATWRDQNRDKIRGYVKKWDSANLEAKRIYGKHWRDNNPDEARAMYKKWRDKNKDKVMESTRNRQARLRGAEGKHTAGDVKRILALQKGLCACCRISLKDKYHVDHIMPLKLGGTNKPDNIQVLCQTCNLRKNAKHPIDFMQQQGYLL